MKPLAGKTQVLKFQWFNNEITLNEATSNEDLLYNIFNSMLNLFLISLSIYKYHNFTLI